ncbi:MAG: hypothetical protein Q9218_004752 [Villophora microphyllina]
MANRVQQDAFMDDSDDSCPLCVEEFDLSDKNFRPCPCGYQVCQFCYNNIKNNMNGLCPACRRPYDDNNIEWKIISPEEQKADIALQARKKAMARQKESERKQVESLNRKHLAGLRVVQKNLVYVVGLNPKSREEDLLQTLRGDQYFGQYGKIIKIVVSKAKENANGNSSIGVYVTFARKQDAASCIAAVDGSQNGDRTLRAQYGTTKYCSAYLRNETCNNRQCMFLHEQGEDHDSFSRQDLSSINAVSTQGPATQTASSSYASKANQQPPQPQPPPQQAPQVVTAASHSMARQGSRDEPMSRSDSGDGSALPSSASWAAKNAQSESRRSSKPSSVSASSPQVPIAQTVSSQPSIPLPPVTAASEQPSQSQDPQPTARSIASAQPPPEMQSHPLDRLLRTITKSSFKFTFDRSLYSPEVLREIDAFPPLFDTNGGLVRYKMEKEREKERLKQEVDEAEEQSKSTGAVNTLEDDENPASGGSLQLGGEPETDDGRQSVGGRQSSEPRSAIQPPLSAGFGGLPFGSSAFGSNNMFNGRSLTPQQQQQLLLLRGMNQQSPVNTNPQGFTGQTSQHHHQQSNPFQNQGQGFSIPGHTRQASRFTFANDTASASTVVKPSTNPQLMVQQSAMMPSSQNKNFQQQNIQPSNIQKTHFYSGVQGPPPGLKSSGTPPISGGGMFGQGHGFTQPMGGPSGLNSAGGTKNTNEQLMQNLLRGRGDTMNGPGSEIGKREFDFPSAFHNPSTSNAPASALLSSLYGSQLGAYNGYQDQGLAKQKKKGKKHRHANTSSSGGGGLVDLADPSILQARMHHGGAGQGHIGLQGQEFAYPPVSNVPVIPSASLSRTQTPKPGDILPPTGPRSKRTTPTPGLVPPGLSLPQDFPPLVAPSVPMSAPSKTQKKATGPTAPTNPIMPAIPVIPSQAAKAVGSSANKDRSAKPLTSKEDLPSPLVADTIGNPITKPRSNKEPSSMDSMAPTQSKKSTETYETTSAGEEKSTSEPSSKFEETAGKDKKGPAKRHPGKLDIEATKNITRDDTEVTASTAASKHAQDAATASSTIASAISQPQTPMTGASQASGAATSKAGQPRTIRVTQTSKNETALKGPTATLSKESTNAGSANPPSRRGSLSSVHLPGTPASERISDNVSMTSASVSRADSPPPSKVGTAPVRHATKSQQKKERQARAKQLEEATKVEEPTIKTPVEEPVQAPIIGRKKKQKKPATRGTADSTPAVTRPSSPLPQGENIVEEEESVPTTPARKDDTKSAVADSEIDNPLSPAATSTTADQPQQQQKNTLTAAILFAQLQRSQEIPQGALDIFKSVMGLNHRFDNIDPHSLEQMPESTLGLPPPLTEAQNVQIDNGEPVCIDQPNNRRIIVLPDRRTLRGLTPEQASRYLALRTQALATSQKLYGAGHGPAPPRTQGIPASSSTNAVSNNTKHLHNPFLEPPQSAPSASANTNYGARLPQAFGSSTSANPTTYVDEAAHFIATRRRDPVPSLAAGVTNGGVGGIGGFGVSVEDAENALGASRRETEGLEKRLNALLKRNRRMVFGGSGA